MTPDNLNKTFDDRLYKILSTCFNARTSTQKYNLEFARARSEIKALINEMLPVQFSDGSVEMTDFFNGWDSYRTELKKRLNLTKGE